MRVVNRSLLENIRVNIYRICMCYVDILIYILFFIWSTIIRAIGYI